jgi:diacylglycerol O-acyltransferase / wax synthase
VERLSTLDAEFLHLEDDVTHLHIAGVSVFEGPSPGLDGMMRLLDSKVHLIPRYRQRVRTVPLELGRPVWVDDPHFNLAYHVRHTALPAPGGDEELCHLMGRLMSQRLDRDRPLWEAWVVEGLADERWALISKVHHCMVDGVSGVDLLSVLLDTERESELPEPPTWTPDPEPSEVAKVLDAWSGLARGAADMAARTASGLRDPISTIRAAARTSVGLTQIGRHLGSTPPLSIEGTIGPHRRWAFSSVSLDDVRAIRRAHPGTVNDVVLAAVTGGYRELLLHRGEDPERAIVRTLVPVSVRTDDGKGVLDNRVSAILYELPVGVNDPVVRLSVVHRQMADLKESAMAEAGEAVTTLGDLAPPMVVGFVSRFASRLMHRLPQRSVNTVTTNVPGPQFPLYCLGREMVAHLPFVPIAEGVRFGTAILSYNGQLAFGVTGDYDTAPDVSLLADSIAEGIDELRERAGVLAPDTC